MKRTKGGSSKGFDVRGRKDPSKFLLCNPAPDEVVYYTTS